MINSIILCEGSTDFALLQYYMRKVNCWEDTKAQHNVIKFDSQKSRLFVKENKQLTIASMGGYSRIEASVGIVLERNFNTSPRQEDAYHNIVIKPLEGKFLAIGSPKFDKVLTWRLLSVPCFIGKK